MITIVSAFYDIGRSDWSAFARSTETYFKSFERLCQLKNDIILFTSTEFRERIEQIQRRKKNLTVYYVDVFQQYSTLLEKIRLIQNDESYKEGITSPSSPEYYEPRYVLINYLKSYFCNEAFKRNTALTGTVAWIDFGYCRKNRFLPSSKQWDYDFGDGIHLFNLLDVSDDIDVVSTIKTNTVYIQGCHIVASEQGWKKLNELMAQVLDELMAKTLIDDDQTLLLLSYLKSKQDFTLHKANLTKKLGWFFIFKHFNRSENIRPLFIHKIMSLFK
jgi:protein YibB